MANPISAYQQNRSLGWTRIDLILAVYDGIMRQLENARARLEMNDAAAAEDLLARARIGICALAGGVAGVRDSKPVANFARLYEFILRRLSGPTADHISECLSVMATLREGFEQARDAARDLERTGALPPLDKQHLVKTSA